MATTSALAPKEIRYGFREGPGKGKEYPVKASQIFHRRGGCFVRLDANGSINVATQTTTTAARAIFGWACVPKDSVATGAAGYWKAAASTADGFPSKVFVIHANQENLFEVPVKAAAVALSDIGDGCTLASANMNATNIQSVKKVSVASAAFTIHDVDTTASTYIVSVRSSIYIPLA